MKILWISTEPGNILVLAFASASEAEIFIKGQSKNPNWWANWTLEFQVLYGTPTCVAKAKNVSIHFK